MACVLGNNGIWHISLKKFHANINHSIPLLLIPDAENREASLENKSITIQKQLPWSAHHTPAKSWWP